MKTATDFMRDAEAHAMSVCGFCGHEDYNRIRNDKFAELIVKECAKVCREQADSGVIVDAGFGEYDEGCNAGLHEAAVTIEAHFGIE